ncbi:MAG: 16S rRNA (guanine(966)-N(2))-methyltransferase RsmD [Actinomycetaceae bacterium]|nr:16S rRNA (guanine(966)-N(2))-methyltransferase RsmD [Actinomycetaceae bacterium]
MTRIVAGRFRGHHLDVPDKGTRPTSGKVREALFSRLDSWGELEDAVVLDLYAGSGALGLEALSRGAASVVLVDHAPGAVRVCRANAARLDTSAVQVVRAKAGSFCRRQWPVPFSLVFLDPPYADDPQQVADDLEFLSASLAPQALLVWEVEGKSQLPTLPAGFELESERKWGQTRVWFVGFNPIEGSVEA